MYNFSNQNFSIASVVVHECEWWLKRIFHCEHMLTFSLETGPIYHYAVVQFRTFNIWDTFTYFDVTKKFFYKFQRNIESGNFNIPTCRLESDFEKMRLCFWTWPPKYNFRGFSLKNFLLGRVKICWVFFPQTLCICHTKMYFFLTYLSR